MSANRMTVWALVPARGGSKSIPLKNLVPLAGVPMLDYGVRAAIACGRIGRIVCSTDDERIARRARELGTEVVRRPAPIAGDDASVVDVARHMLDPHPRGSWPDLLALVQPTSPFLLPEHCSALIEAMAARPDARSGQTVCRVPHNHHAVNQRVVENGLVRFRAARERAAAQNKQQKDDLFVFGNLVIARPEALMSEPWFFAEPSVAVEIGRPYDIDVDGPDDVVVAEALLRAGAVRLPHMLSRVDA